MKLSSFMEPKPIVELHTFRHPADEQVRLSYRYNYTSSNNNLPSVLFGLNSLLRAIYIHPFWRISYPCIGVNRKVIIWASPKFSFWDGLFWFKVAIGTQYVRT